MYRAEQPKESYPQAACFHLTSTGASTVQAGSHIEHAVIQSICVGGRLFQRLGCPGVTFRYQALNGLTHLSVRRGCFAQLALEATTIHEMTQVVVLGSAAIAQELQIPSVRRYVSFDPHASSPTHHQQHQARSSTTASGSGTFTQTTNTRNEERTKNQPQWRPVLIYAFYCPPVCLRLISSFVYSHLPTRCSTPLCISCFPLFVATCRFRL